MSVTVYAARSIITMDPSCPIATHVAVKDGKVLSVGTLEEVSAWGDYQLDTQFSDKVLMPGMIEGHSHILEGALWDHAYIGFYDRLGPDGTTHAGLTDLEAVIDKLKELDAALPDPNTPLVGWGFDPIFFGGTRIKASDLDRVSTTRPIVLLHASLHLLNTNSEVLRRSEIDRSINLDVVFKDEHGEPTGEFASMVGIYLATKGIDFDMMGASTSSQSLRNFANLCRLSGVTTVTDLHSDLNEQTVARYVEETSKPDYPCRLVTAFGGTLLPPAEGLARVQAAQKSSTDKARFGLVKLVADGSIQGFTARLKWPGYFNGNPNGLWYIEPSALVPTIKTYHDAGHQLHIHTNGNETTEAVIEALEEVLRGSPWGDHRHTLQHCQMADEAQFNRMADLGIGVNLFSNHIYYWGDLHYSTILGPDRANKIDNAGAALKNGVPLAIHSDAPITPIDPLFTAWCAINRTTSSGRVLGGDEEALDLDEALYTITMGAARSLKMDGEVGSIEVGKWADFAVLEDDPYELGPENLKDIRVWGTVLGGRIFSNAD